MQPTPFRIARVLAVVTAIAIAATVAAAIAKALGVDLPWPTLVYHSAIGVCIALAIVLACIALVNWYPTYCLNAAQASGSPGAQRRQMRR